MKEEAIKAPGSTIKQYSIMLQNRVGALTALLGLLDMHGIFCLGFSMQDCHEATIARLIVSDPERTSGNFSGERYLLYGVRGAGGGAPPWPCRPQKMPGCAVCRGNERQLSLSPAALRGAGVSGGSSRGGSQLRAHRAEFQRHQSPVPAGPQPVGTAVFPFFPAALFRSVFSKRLKGLPGFFALTGGENMVWYGPHGKSTRNQSSQGTRGQLQQ